MGLMTVRDAKQVPDLGAVCVSFTGPDIDSIRFADPWPVGRFREGRHFMDERFTLPLAEGSTTVFQTKASSDGLAWAKPHWYRYFGDDVAGELETIIDGHFVWQRKGYQCGRYLCETTLLLKTIRRLSGF